MREAIQGFNSTDSLKTHFDLYVVFGDCPLVSLGAGIPGVIPVAGLLRDVTQLPV